MLAGCVLSAVVVSLPVLRCRRPVDSAACDCNLDIVALASSNWRLRPSSLIPVVLDIAAIADCSVESASGLRSEPAVCRWGVTAAAEGEGDEYAGGSSS